MQKSWKSPIPLHQISDHTCCTVVSLHVPAAMRQRLQDLGLIAGTKIYCLQNPKRKPMLLWIRSTWIALRQCDAKYILVDIQPQTN